MFTEVSSEGGVSQEAHFTVTKNYYSFTDNLFVRELVQEEMFKLTLEGGEEFEIPVQFQEVERRVQEKGGAANHDANGIKSIGVQVSTERER